MSPTGSVPPLMPGTTVTDTTGTPVGRVMHVFGEPVTGAPEWASVAPGGAGEWVLVPLADSALTPAGVVLGHSSAVVLAGPVAPNRDTLLDDEVLAATAYYYSPSATGTAATAGVGAPQPVPQPAPPSVTVHDGDGEVDIVRSEEQLRVGTQTVVSQRLRLRKVVVTEEQTVTVTVRREEFRLETEDVTDPAPTPGGLDTLSADDLGGTGELVLTLHAERPVVTTEVVPVERVRVVKHVVTGEQTVAAMVRREVVDGLEQAPAHP